MYHLVPSRTFFIRLCGVTAMLIASLVGLRVLAAGPALSAAMTPATATIAAGQTQIFVMTATDPDGTSRDVTAETVFSTNDPLGSVSGASYHAGKVGTWTVQGTYQSFTSTANVTVTPGALQEITINPNSDPELVNLHATKKFTARGFDGNSNPEDINVVWSVIGEMGTIDANGVFTGTKLGTGKVQAAVGTVTGEVAVTVRQTLVVPTANQNTNTAAANANQNVNQASNANVANTNTASSSTTKKSDCKTLSNWVWVLILIMFLLGVAILYALVPVTKVWPAVIGLGGAVALVAVQRAYGCEVLGWWGWVVALGTLAMTIFAMRQLPMPKSNP